MVRHGNGSILADNSMLTRSAFLILLLTLPCLCSAQLHWDKPEQELHAGPADDKAAVAFELANTGDHPVKILSDQSGCDCTVTDDPKQPRAKLILKGTIPEIVTFSTKLLNWEAGEDPKPKIITLSIAEGSKTKLGKIEASSDQVQTELKETGPGRYDLVVTPSANAQGTIVLKIHCDNPDGGPKTYQAYAHFPTPPPAAPPKPDLTKKPAATAPAATGH
jgi:hypothetical protein